MVLGQVIRTSDSLRRSWEASSSARSRPMPRPGDNAVDEIRPDMSRFPQRRPYSQTVNTLYPGNALHLHSVPEEGEPCWAVSLRL